MGTSTIGSDPEVHCCGMANRVVGQRGRVEKSTSPRRTGAASPSYCPFGPQGCSARERTTIVQVNFMNKLMASLVVVGALAAPAAQAQIYLGGAWGSSNIGYPCTDGISCDKSDRGHRLSIGYRFSPVFSVEINRFDFGSVERQGRTTVLSVPVNVAESFKVTGLGLGMEVRPALGGQVYGIGRWGLVRMKGQSGVGYSASSTTPALTAKSRSSTQMYVGLGLGYALWDGFTVELTADLSGAQFDDGTTNSRELRLIGLGATYRF